jgi:transcriptional regulator with XRE-family HTH domain
VQIKYDTDRLGGVIKSTRYAKQLTQCQLSEQLGITPGYLKAIENSGRKPSYDLFVKIVHELGISANVIMQPENEKSTAKLYILESGRKPG